MFKLKMFNIDLEHNSKTEFSLLFIYLIYMYTYRSVIKDVKVLESVISIFQIADLANEDTPQLYTLCGRGPRSSLRVLRHGLEVNIVFDF